MSRRLFSLLAVLSFVAGFLIGFISFEVSEHTPATNVHVTPTP
jgi:hypothetical protein